MDTQSHRKSPDRNETAHASALYDVTRATILSEASRFLSSRQRASGSVARMNSPSRWNMAHSTNLT